MGLGPVLTCARWGIDLPRPRPLALEEAPALEGHVRAIYGIFEEMGVLHGKDAGSRGECPR